MGRRLHTSRPKISFMCSRGFDIVALHDTNLTLRSENEFTFWPSKLEQFVTHYLMQHKFCATCASPAQRGWRTNVRHTKCSINKLSKPSEYTVVSM
jgi:hypothetical protein